MRTLIILISLLCASVTAANELILQENSLGPLQLNKETIISLSILKKHFPQYIITHGIGQGDSPDFHYFDVKDTSSNIIFTAISYIENESDKSKKNVKLDLLEIYSATLMDEYKLKIGMRLKDIISLRGNNLTFGANHHDNHIGLNNIWYALSTDELADANGPDINPENITYKNALMQNPQITRISWPYARW